MKITASILSGLLAPMILAGTAAAQGAPAPEAAAAQSSDVSQINGHPVPVGDHNQYHYTYRRWNVSSNPIGWILGSYGLSVSHAFHPNVAVRADVNYFSPVDSDVDGFELGMGLPIYFRRAYQGVFLEPGVIVRTFDDGVDQDTTIGPQVLVGWHWSWDSGLNVAAALGAGRNFSADDNPDSPYDDDEIFANGYLRFGYSF